MKKAFILKRVYYFIFKKEVFKKSLKVSFVTDIKVALIKKAVKHFEESASDNKKHFQQVYREVYEIMGIEQNRYAELFVTRLYIASKKPGFYEKDIYKFTKEMF